MDPHSAVYVLMIDKKISCFSKKNPSKSTWDQTKSKKRFNA